jgi:MoaA/NifB/PqqE/SkfB family radical SAM enzyme
MAEVKPSYDSNRKNLSEVIPLDSPLSMYIEPTRKCNFKCFYCMHGTRGVEDGQLEKTGFRIDHMEESMFYKIVKDVMEFPTPLKRICFSGLGDPLMNRELPKMVKKLRENGFKERIDVITNGVLLTPEMSDELIKAGISRVQVSIQGLDSQEYEKVSGVQVDFDKLVNNVKYFYEHRKSATIFVKIIDSLLKDKKEEEKFFKTFDGICDTIFVEHLVIMQQQMGDHGGIVDATRNLNGEYVEPRQVCGVMFYFLQVNIDGETFPCSTPGLPNGFTMGNVKDKSLVDIWNDKKRNALMRANLSKGYKSIPACTKCSSCIAIADDSEYLDDCREEMLAKLPECEG